MVCHNITDRSQICTVLHVSMKFCKIKLKIYSASASHAKQNNLCTCISYKQQSNGLYCQLDVVLRHTQFSKV